MLTLKDFIKKYTGIKCGNTDANFGECVGIAMLWVENLNLSHVWGNAKDIYSNALTSEYKKIKNAPGVYPVEGDIITWDNTWGGGFGHIAVVVSSDTVKDTFTVFEQNNPLGNPPRTHTYTKWNGVQGWLHPLVLDVEPIEDKITSLEKALSDMTANKDEWKTKAKDLETTVKDLKKEIETKDKDFLNLKSICEELENKRNEIAILNDKLNKEIESITLELKTSHEVNLSLEDRLNKIQVNEYSLSELMTMIFNKLKGRK